MINFPGVLVTGEGKLWGGVQTAQGGAYIGPVLGQPAEARIGGGAWGRRPVHFLIEKEDHARRRGPQQKRVVSPSSPMV